MPRTEEAEEIKKKGSNRKVIISQGGNIIAIKDQLEATESEIAKMKSARAEIKAMEKEVAKLKAQLNKLAAK